MAGYEELVDRRRPILRYVMSGGLLIVLGVLVWILVAAVRHEPVDKPASNASSSAQNESNGSSSSDSSIAANSATGSPTGNSSTPPASSQSSPAPSSGGQSAAANTAPAASGSQAQLADTGPGDVLLLFFAATFLGWLIHYRHAKRSARAA